MMSASGFYNLYFLFALWMLFNACASSKSIPEGEFLYTGANISIDKGKEWVTEDLLENLSEVLTPEPNSKIIGIPLRLHLYQLFDNGKEKGFFPGLRDLLGQPPVLLDPSKPSDIRPTLRNQLFNNGYFRAEVTSEIWQKKHLAGITYNLSLNQPYSIDSFDRHVEDIGIDTLINSMELSENLQRGNNYNLTALREERARIALYLKQHGYYYFSEEYLKFQIDSTNKNHSLDVRLELRTDVEQAHLDPYHIDRIEVYTSNRKAGEGRQTFYEEGINFNYMGRKSPLRPRVILDQLDFRRGNRYSLEWYNDALRNLVNLGVFSFVNIRFEESSKPNMLDMEVLLSLRKAMNMTGTLGVSYVNNEYLGPEIEWSFIHRNLFRGGARLRASVFTNLYFPLGKSERNFYEKSGAELQLSVPRLTIPFIKNKAKKYSLAKTNYSLNYARERINLPLADVELILQGIEERGVILKIIADAIGATIDDLADLRVNRLLDELRRDNNYAPYVGINSLQLTFGYQWRISSRALHEFNPIKLGFQFGEYENSQLKDFLILTLIFTKYFETLAALENMIFGSPEYIFLYDSRERGIKENNFFYRARTSVIGNSIIQGSEKKIFDLSGLRGLYFQWENDLRYYRVTAHRKYTVATRLVINMALPIKDEIFLPFLTLYSVGGPNSVRAYTVQELGPGSLTGGNKKEQVEDVDLFLYNGRGDLQLEGSMEYRYMITRSLELAAFLDVGNVWLLNSPILAARFQFSNFWKKIGLGTGIGLRLKFDPLVLRLDLAFPLTKPWLGEGKRWVGNQIDLLSGKWRNENLRFNLSFGYPF